MKYNFAKIHNTLVPADNESAEAIGKFKPGEIIYVEISKPRNIKHHRLYWALVSLVYENQSTYQSKEIISDLLKISAGHAELVKMPGGGEYYRPKSISFGSMDQIEFSEFWERICRYACEFLIPGMDSEALKSEAYDMVDVNGLLKENI